MVEKLVITGVLGFASGILCRSFLSIPWPAIAFVSVLGCVCLLLLLASKRRLLYALLSILFLSAALGMARVALAPSALPETFEILIGTDAVLEGTVVSDPDVRETSSRLTVRIEQEGDSTRILAVAPLYPVVRIGETVRISGVVERPEPFSTGDDRMFAYDRYLAKDGVYLIMQPAGVTVLESRRGFWQVRGILSDFKFGFIDALGNALPEPHASLAAGLIAGGKQGLGAELLDAFTRTGLVHIVVLSGYNVMIIAEAILVSLGFLSKRVAALVAGLVIGAFVLAAGAGAASIRAGLMAGIALYARATHKTYAVIRALAAAFVLMLLWNPYLLAFDPGFQLSFLATLGLIFGTPLIEPRLTRIRPAFLRDVMAATLAAQIAVLPLILFNTGLLSLIALPANVVVLPLVPFAMAASALAGLAGFLVPASAPLLGLPAYALLSYIIAATEFAAGIPAASVTVPAFSFVLVIAAYAMLSLAVWKWFRSTRTTESS